MSGRASPQSQHAGESTTSQVVRIKGYLPVRLRFTGSTRPLGDDARHKVDNDDDCTFFYVKEHQPPGSRSHNSDTLFIANCPVHPTVSSKRLLHSVLGRYGDVRRVTLMDHPRRVGPSSATNQQDGNTSHNKNKHDASGRGVEEDEDEDDTMAVLGSWTNRFVPPSFLPAHAVPSSSRVDHGDDVDDNQQQSSSTSSSSDNGKFAHVVFRSGQDLKRTLRRLTQVMASAEDPAVTMDAVELQTLADAESSHHHDDDDGDDDRPQDVEPIMTGLKAVAARYRAGGRRFMNSASNGGSGRAQLLEECNRVVQAWEEQMEVEQRRLQVAAQEPDDDGFVTVTTTTTTTTAPTLETAPNARGGRRSSTASRGGSRKKKKTMGGAQPLSDFYRFQTKETRKRSLQELRERFEQDLAKVQKRRQERQYAQPFG